MKNTRNLLSSPTKLRVFLHSHAHAYTEQKDGGYLRMRVACVDDWNWKSLHLRSITSIMIQKW
jgi:hypothetical protein